MKDCQVKTSGKHSTEPEMFKVTTYDSRGVERTKVACLDHAMASEARGARVEIIIT
jgi:hypothetical protein